MQACVLCQTPNNLQFDREPLMLQRSQRQQTQIRKGPACTRNETFLLTVPQICLIFNKKKTVEVFGLANVFETAIFW